MILFFIAVLGIELTGCAGITNFPRSNRESPQNTCINNLRLLDAAEQQWALEHEKNDSAVPTWDDLKEYLGNDSAATLKCPLGGTYTLAPVCNKPTCSYPGHRLP